MTLPRDEDLKGSEVRLWSLIAARAEPGADTARIDERVWDLFGCEAAVVFTDLSGFSRHVVAFGIIDFLQVIFEMKRMLLPIVAAHDGILIKVEADSFLIVFKRADSALRCSIAMQQACKGYNDEQTAEKRVVLCVGIGFGSILKIGDADVYGQEVNAASKLGEDIARGDEILVTDAAREACGAIAGVAFTDLERGVAGSEKNFRVTYPRG